MQKIKLSQLLFVGLSAFIISASSCQKNNTTPTTTTGKLALHLHTNVDTSEVGTYGDTLTMTGGRRIVVSKAQLYISGIQLIKTDGSAVNTPSISILKLQDTEPYTVGDVAVGNYKSLKFNAGLSAASNASYPVNTDLVLYRPEMWFNASAQPGGFVFVLFQGSIDTAITPSKSNPLIPFSYKIGTDMNLKSVTMPSKDYAIIHAQTTEVHMVIDYANLFKGVALSNINNLKVNTTNDNAGALGIQISNNIVGMFKYQ